MQPLLEKIVVFGYCYFEGDSGFSMLHTLCAAAATGTQCVHKVVLLQVQNVHKVALLQVQNVYIKLHCYRNKMCT